MSSGSDPARRNAVRAAATAISAADSLGETDTECTSVRATDRGGQSPAAIASATSSLAGGRILFTRT